MGKVADDVIESFAALVGRAESGADSGNRAELARFQLQGLAGTVSALAAGQAPDDVVEALATLRAFVAANDTTVDRVEGDALRAKVSAYRVLADDLDLDPERLDDLLARWDATAPSGGRARGKGSGRSTRATSNALEACPVCGQHFKRVRKHMSAAHPDEWAKSQ
jgi:hypothetical protein